MSTKYICRSWSQVMKPTVITFQFQKKLYKYRKDIQENFMQFPSFLLGPSFQLQIVQEAYFGLQFHFCFEIGTYSMGNVSDGYLLWVMRFQVSPTPSRRTLFVPNNLLPKFFLQNLSSSLSFMIVVYGTTTPLS